MWNGDSITAVSAGAGQAAGIDLTNASGAIQVVNDGSIAASNTRTTNNAGAVGVNAYISNTNASGSIDITNTGTVSASTQGPSLGAIAFRANNQGQGDVSMLNTGTILVPNFVGGTNSSVGAWLTARTGSVFFTNTGAIGSAAEMSSGVLNIGLSGSGAAGAYVENAVGGTIYGTSAAINLNGGAVVLNNAGSLYAQGGPWPLPERPSRPRTAG